LASSTTTEEPIWLAARRERAATLTGELDLPVFKGRPGWEFTDLTHLDLAQYAPVNGQGGDAAALGNAGQLFKGIEGALHLEQVDGLPVGDVAVPDAPTQPLVLPLSVAATRFPELVEGRLGSVVDDADPFVARNQHAWTGGAFVYVPRGVKLDAPVSITAVQSAAQTALSWRTLIVLDEGAEAEVWEQWLSADPKLDALFNGVTEIVVGPNARLTYVCGQELSEKTWVFGSQRAEVERDGTIDWVALGFGSANGKVHMETKLAGRGSHAKVTGAYATHSRQHVDFDTLQEHAAENTTSDLAFRGILDGRSSAVWSGMIQVDKGAQQTDAFQDSRNLLLSKKAHADAIPGLEILANDVRCTHAAAIAQIDKEQVFYLRSHGLPLPAATRLVIEGFLAALVDRFQEGPVRDAVAEALERRLGEILGVLA
jgi:Fe-S cluster assembly protein SufD